jgi:multimeric flavodoxin WrbA
MAATTSKPPNDGEDMAALSCRAAHPLRPEQSHAQGLADRAMEIMRRQGVTVETVRAVDLDIATGVWPDMTQYGWERDDWPAIFEQVMAAGILVLSTSIGLGEKTSVCTKVIERLHGNSHLLNLEAPISL